MVMVGMSKNTQMQWVHTLPTDSHLIVVCESVQTFLLDSWYGEYQKIVIGQGQEFHASRHDMISEVSHAVCSNEEPSVATTIILKYMNKMNVGIA